ncbi:WGR domain-containing protein [Leptospira borgpetersenii]|uniref:WGR domain-containing protein n=1 Tax=Leptospira borgpetersenii TaxID=174 RepID=UPI00077371AF|nr:WGR domain-containing protein [Leptospira borgpetersenii]MBE8365225.1 WGR domain-containing protein [Leptospira borgpetersenii serovar Balcanica]MBE8366586.1 WGR domain-containing protein [Leptospira borgpetersenii serovar Balcanica]MBE8399421.1 WGR domain-containing protein [Leptospira borgpetersenii serovar Tarassovi]MBE8404456.1 WGR domain-containing protein [Leptospira borgpetersenii serovar Tarassovi]MBE8407312.1 WGR domain-containing protein [Leptospira borgpetersenii serovar Tarassov
MKHHLTYKDDSSDKFWNIEVSGKSFTVTYGKTGTNGQTQTKDFDSEEKCLKEAKKLLSEKLKKGYVEGSNFANTKSSTTDTIIKSQEPKIDYLKEWQAIVDAKDLHKALIEHFSYLGDNPRFKKLLEAILKKVVNVSCSEETLEVTFPKYRMLCTSPLKQIPAEYPRSYQDILKKHKTIELSDYQCVLGEHGRFAQEVQDIWFEDLDEEEMGDSHIFEFIKTKKLLHVPIADGMSGNFWIYHPNKKNSLGEPTIYYLESDGEMICNPQSCNAGSVFLKKLAECLSMQMAMKEILSGAKATDYQVWWDSLDSEWKKFLTDSCYRKEEPAAEALALKSLGGNTDTYIKTLEPLRSMKLLKTLSLFVPNINDISPLINLKKLKDLRIQSTNILDFSPIGKLVNLEKLTIIFTKSIELDLSWLESLTKLDDLLIYVKGEEEQIRVKSFHALHALKSLVRLSLMNIRSTTREKISIEPLSALTKLEELELRDFSLKSLEPLYKLESLKIITLSDSSVDRTEDIKNAMPWCKVYY